MVAQAAVLGLDRIRLLAAYADNADCYVGCQDRLGGNARGCTRTVALLADYLEHRLPPEVHMDLERHLAACRTCITQLRTYESTLSLLRSLREEDLPVELRYSLRSFIDAHSDCN